MRKILIYIKRNWFIDIIVSLLSITVICLIASGVLYIKGEGWLSNVLISLACGFASGLILYFLTNIRNVKNNRINEYYMYLKNIIRLLTDIRRDANYYKDYEEIWGEETKLCLRCEKLISRVEAFQSNIEELPEKLFMEFTGSLENVLLENAVDAIIGKYNEIEDYDDLTQYEQTYIDIVEYMTDAEKIIKPIYDKYRVMYKEMVDSIL